VRQQRGNLVRELLDRPQLVAHTAILTVDDDTVNIAV
jgi:hypothetical protein